MHRTNILLTDAQRDGLKTLAVISGETSSEIVRRAIDRALVEGFAGNDWRARFEAVVENVRTNIPEEISAEQILAAQKRVRRKRKQKLQGVKG